MRTRSSSSSSKLLMFSAGLALALATAACSDDDGPKPDSKQNVEAGLDMSKADAGGDSSKAEAGADMSKAEAGADMSKADAGGDSGADAGAGTSINFGIDGTQEVPSVTTSASGTGKVTINSAETQITVEITYSNLSNITAAHIHTAPLGSNGGVIFTLSSGSFTSPFSKTLTASDFSSSGSVNTFADAIAAIKAGNTYVNIHTTGNPGGEIRGQIVNP